MQKKILNFFFLGCGKMGSILVENMIERSGVKPGQIMPGQFMVLKKSDQNKIPKINYVKNVKSLPESYQADLVFLAVKPQEAQEILTKFQQEGQGQNIFHKNTIFISILAGKKLTFFENIFGKDAKIIRSMPNLPIQDSQGIFPYLPNKNIAKSELKNLQKIFAKFGLSFELENENLFDAITAICGSGPAYIFLLQEIFTEITINAGISKDNASDLIKTLFLGSALMSCNSKSSFSQLRESVTSKGGTTEAALQILQNKSSLKKLFQKAVDVAVKKSKELGNEQN